METQQIYPSFFDLTNSLLDSNTRFTDSTTLTFENFSIPLAFSTTSLEDDARPQSFSIDDSNYEASKVILFKKVPYEATEFDVVSLCQPFGIVSDVYLMKNKGYAFIQFQNLKSAMNCYETFKRTEAKIKGSPVFIFHTGKKDIYKPEGIARPPSRYLLLVMNTNTEAITTLLVNRMLGSFGNVLQVNIFQTKPPSAYIEMEDIGAAITAKEALDETLYAGSIQVQAAYMSFKAYSQATQNGFASMPSLQGRQYQSMEELPPGINPFSYSEGFIDDMDRVEKQVELVQKESNKTDKLNNTLMIKNLPKGISCYQIFKLFGMYGNVMKVKIFFSNPENALVEFQDNTQSILAKTHLNNCPLLGNNVFVTVSKNSIISNTPYIPENNKFIADYSDSKEHRYKIAGSKNFRNIAPPSPVLHLSNLCDDKEESFYKDLFRECGRIKKFLWLKGDTKNMLVEMENVNQSVAILIYFHNYNIDGKFLKVSFSKYQMIKE